MNSPLFLYYLVLLIPGLFIQWNDSPATGWKRTVLPALIELSMMLLIGTLLSSSLSILWAFLISGIL